MGTLWNRLAEANWWKLSFSYHEIPSFSVLLSSVSTLPKYRNFCKNTNKIKLTRHPLNGKWTCPNHKNSWVHWISGLNKFQNLNFCSSVTWRRRSATSWRPWSLLNSYCDWKKWAISWERGLKHCAVELHALASSGVRSLSLWTNFSSLYCVSEQWRLWWDHADMQAGLSLCCSPMW